MKENGKVISETVKELRLGQMVLNISVNGATTKHLDKVNLFTSMVMSMKATGPMTKQVDLVFTST